MKALVIEEPLKMHLTEIPRPELESGEALIRVPTIRKP